MRLHISFTTALALATALLGSPTSGHAAGQEATLAFSKATVTIEGTSNIHDWTATSSSVRITRAEVAPGVGGDTFWDALVKPGALRAFDVTLPAASLSSPRSGLDKNMHKALKVREHADIRFRLQRLAASSAPGVFSAIGHLTVGGVEREVTLALTLARSGDALVVKGTTELLMTDFGIDPPTALLGTVRSSPKVTVAFQTVLTSPLT